MCRKIVINSGVLLGLLAFLSAVFFLGKGAKQKWIIYKTLQSRHWKERTAEIEKTKPGKYKVIFLGNSLTEMFDLNYYFNDSTILNCGIVGDFTEGVVKRANAIIRLKPQKLFIEIGINDIIEQVPAVEILSNYEKLIKMIKQGSPRTKIYIQNNLPVIMYRPSFLISDKRVNASVTCQNDELQELAVQNEVVYIDLYTAFKRSGDLRDLVVEDGVHLTDKAYAVWRNEVLSYLY